MEYNKRQYNKTNNKKVLHKVKKNWVVMSMALLSAIGGGAAVTHVAAHADTNAGNQNPANQTQSSAAAVPKVKLSTNASQISSNAISQNSTQTQGASNPKVIMHQATNLYQNVLMNAAHQAHNNVKSPVQPAQKDTVGNISTKSVRDSSSHVGRFLRTVNGHKVYEITPAQEEQMKQKVHHHAIKRSLGASAKRDLGASASDGQIFIHYLIPSDNYKLAKNPEVTSDPTGTKFTPSDLQQFLTLIPGGYTNPRLDPRPGFNDRPTEYKGVQYLNIDVDKKKSQTGYLRIMYVDKNHNNIEAGQYVLSQPSGTKVQYKDIAGYLLLAPTGYVTDNYKYYNPQDPGQPTTKGAYLGDINPNTFNMSYETKMPTLNIEVVPSDSKPTLGKPIFIHYINQHGVDVDTMQDAEPFTGDIGATFNALQSAPIPEGYHLAHPTNTSYEYASDTQNFNIDVAGDALTSPLPFTIDRTTNSGKSLPSKTLSVTGQVGDTFTVDPNKYSPSGYYPDTNKDQAYTGMIMPDKTLSKNQITYQYDTDPKQQTAQPIHVYYYNQNGALVNTTKDDTPIEGSLNSTVNLTDANNAPVPNGYQLNPGQNTSYQIKNYTQNIPLFVTGIKQSKSLKIHRHEEIVGPNGQPGEPTNTKLSDMSDTVTNETGNTSIIPSSDFQPTGDVSANSDMFHDTVEMTPDGLNPSSIDFTYNTSYKHNHMSDEQPNGEVVLKDKDENNKVIKSIPVSGILGKPVNFNEVMSDITDLPSDVYLVKSDLPSEEFPQNSKAVYAESDNSNSNEYPVMVGDYGFATLDFDDDKSGQTLSSVPLKAPVGSAFDIMDPVKAFFSSDTKDQVAADSPYNPYTGAAIKATNTSKPVIKIYIEPKQHIVNATLLFEDQTNGNKQVGSLPISGEAGDSIAYQSYQKQIPSDYAYERLDPSDATTFESKPVKGHDKYIIYVGKLVNAKIVYQNTSDNKPLSDVESIKGIKGSNMQKYYDQYSIQVPMGYVLGNNNRNSWNKPLSDGATYTINVVPKQKSDIQATLKYIDDTDGSLVKSYTLNGKAGNTPTKINYDQYSIPSDYKIDNTKLAQDTKDPVVKSGETNVIYVEPLVVTGTVTMENSANNYKQVGQPFQISDAPNAKINFSNYTSDIPSNYEYDQSTKPQTMSRNGKFTMLVTPKPVTVHIEYENVKNNNSDVHTSDATGPYGTPIDYNMYTTTKVPYGYTYVNKGVHDSDFEAGHTEVIQVEPQDMKTNLHYYDETNYDQPIKTASIEVPYNTPVTYDQYMRNVPANYTIDGQSINTTSPILGNDKDVVVYVRPTAKPKISDHIVFEDTTNGYKSVGNPISISGTQGSQIDYSGYQNGKGLPKNYAYAGMGKHDTDYTANNHDEVVLVKPVINKATAHVLYYDMTDKKIVGTATISGQEGSTVNYLPYEVEGGKYMPGDYRFVAMGKYDPQLKDKGVNVINVAPKEETTTVDYLDNATHKLIHSDKVSGLYSQPFTYNVPEDYQMASASVQKPVYQDHTPYNVYVKPREETTTIDYLDNTTHKLIHSDKVSGLYSQPFTYNVPSGYQMISASVQKPVYQDHAPYSVYVVPKAAKPTMATETLIFQDEQTGKPVGQTTMNGISGTEIKYNDYMSQIPAGYQYAGMKHYDINYANGDTSVMLVTKNNPQPKVSNVTARVLYYDMTNKKIVGTASISGPEDSTVDYVPYEVEGGKYMPANYHFVMMGDHDPQLKNDGVDVIDVEQNSTNSTPSTVTTDVRYETPNGKVIANQPIAGLAGTSIDYNNYIPAGYQMTGQMNGDSTFQNNGQTTVYVKPIAKPTKKQIKHSTKEPSQTKAKNHGKTVRHSAPVANYHGSKGLRNRITGSRMPGASYSANGNAPMMNNGGMIAPEVGSYGESTPQSQQNGNKLPQTGEQSSRAKEIAAALIALSAGIDALGVFVRRRHDDNE